MKPTKTNKKSKCVLCKNKADECYILCEHCKIAWSGFSKEARENLRKFIDKSR